MKVIYTIFPSQMTTSKEIWRKIHDFPDYFISNMGRLKLKSGNFSKMKPRFDGYVRTSLRKGNVAKSFFFHVLVADAFIPNPDNKKLIDHINGNRHDNRVENLRRATAKENSNNKHKPAGKKRGRKVIQYDLAGNQIKVWNSIIEAAKTLKISKSNIPSACAGRINHCGGFKWEYYEEQMEDEEWRAIIIDDQEVKISSFGRIITKTGVITIGGKTGQYLSISINSISHCVHRLVCLAFHPIDNPDDYVANHIDNVKTNNRADNLEWVTESENRIHAEAFRENKVYNCKRVEQFSLEGKSIAKFNSMQEATEITGVNKGNICSVCKGDRKNAGGFIWRHIIEEDNLSKFLQDLDMETPIPIIKKKKIVVNKYSDDESD